MAACEGFLALLAVLWLLLCTVYVCAIADCELDMSNSMQGYDWTKSFVFLEARNGKRFKSIRLVADLSSQTSRRSAEFEGTQCVTPVNRNSYHASFLTRLERWSPQFLRAGELVEFIISCYLGIFKGIFVDLLLRVKSIQTVPTLPSYKEYSAPRRLK